MTVQAEENIKNKWLYKYRFLEYPLAWLRMFYPNARVIPAVYLLVYFFSQKILRINGGATWPVHFTSRIMNAGNIKVGNRAAPGINSGCYVQARNGIIIGNNLRMGPKIGRASCRAQV